MDKYPILICLQVGVLAKISLLPESVQELWGAEADLFGSISVAYEKNSQDILYGKTLKELCLAEEVGISQTFSLLFPKVGILFGGKFSTPKTSVFLKTESVSLSAVLETKIPKKYFLSEKKLPGLFREKNYENKLATPSGQIIPMDEAMKLMFLPGVNLTEQEEPNKIENEKIMEKLKNELKSESLTLLTQEKEAEVKAPRILF